MKLLILLCFILPTTTFAQSPEDSFHMRVSWVKTLKKLMVEIEKKKPYKLSQSERKLLEFSLIKNAYAESDSPYNCFYGGWPSVKKGESCQNPVETNASYNKNACKRNEFQCQPLLFGKGHCAPATDKNNLFANCEKKFKNFDHLKNMPREEIQELQEMSTVAGQICKDDDSPACKEVMKKIQDGLKSIDDAFRVNPKSFLKNELTLMPETPQPARREPVPVATPHTDDCPTEDHSHSVVNSVKRLQEVATSGVDELYDAIQADFKNSPFCDPHSVISDPNEKPSPVATSLLLADLYFMNFMKANKRHPSENLAQLKSKYKLSDETINAVTPLLDEVYRTPQDNDHTRTLIARSKAILVQGFLKDYRHDPNLLKKEIEGELVKKHIFTKNSEGKAECPFVNKDAFMKALAGRESVLKSHGGSLKNKKQITIVDYSRPSNERRMFVIDLESKKVLHNTWVAHGGGTGGKEYEGKDGLGGSASMSNRSGSNLSSDGFIIATAASHGKMFGPNVILKGIDENNTNMQARAVILHKWNSPYSGYSAGVQDYISDTDSFGPVYDVTQKMKTTDFRNASRKDAEKILSSLGGAVYAPKVMSTTQGCLGVPLNNIKHLDRKGRNTDQVQALREDLPGSLIFSYSGPEMSSKFF